MTWVLETIFGRKRINRAEEDFEPLGAVEQAWLDAWRKVEGPQGCHWIDDASQYCNKPRTQLRSRHPYCEEHLRRSLTEAGWQRVLAAAAKQ